MKAYKVELLIVDHDGLGKSGIVEEIQSASYGNDCIMPRVMLVEEREIGDWHDEHPLNHKKTIDAEYVKMFKHPPTEPMLPASEVQRKFRQYVHAAERQRSVASRREKGNFGIAVDKDPQALEWQQYAKIKDWSRLYLEEGKYDES